MGSRLFHHTSVPGVVGPGRAVVSSPKPTSVGLSRKEEELGMRNGRGKI